MNAKKILAAAGLLAGLLAAGAVHAQATATWVSGVGDDANPCSRTAPCKTFAGAISKTAAGGIIRTLDPGGYGGLTITKAITIEGVPGQSHSLVTGVSGFTINATATDLVVIRNLIIDGTNSTPNTAGVKIVNAGMVVVENTVIQRSGAGVDVQATALATRVDMRNVAVTGSIYGVRTASPGASIAISGSTLRGNGTALFITGGEVALMGSSILHNTLAFSLSNGTISSSGDNAVFGNDTDGLKLSHQKSIHLN